MKKKIIIVVLFSLLSAVYAVDSKFDFGIGLAVVNSDMDVKASYRGKSTRSSSDINLVGFEFNLGSELFFSDSVGIGTKLGFIFPNEGKVTQNGVTSSVKYGTVQNGVQVDAYEYNFFMGCALRPYNSDKLYFIITPGIDIDIFWETEKASGVSMVTKFISGGLGADLQLGFKFSKKIALNLDMLFEYNFISKVDGGVVDYYRTNGMTVEAEYKPFIYTPTITLSIMK